MFDSILKLFSPSNSQCVFCHAQKKNNKGMFGLCDLCTQSIPWIRSVECQKCGRYEKCYDCIKRKEVYFEVNRSAVQYSDEMREWLARYKYRGDESLLPLLIEMLRFPCESLIQALSRPKKQFDCITYIPLSPERLAERGFNQAEQLAQGIGKLYGIPVIPLLVRVLHSGKQSYKTRGQRLSDLQHVFKYRDNSTLELKGDTPLNIILVDDVYTTGSTLNQASSSIRKHLNAQVYGLTWAR
ncbi:ComF family protein [Paenibacillus psychroresistens]|uniref:ComF family protein n=1 Tax=Paenibacillus psychroresistens TaxID=1778678 RepID=A0A6B8RD61_9BACL|nr:ComF family protein [Paenibacillus psychroresistens]QGQ93513.1 ComF family protein [Paenibacillus psychroresistens]